MTETKRLAKSGKFFITRHCLKRLKERHFIKEDVEKVLLNGSEIPDSQEEEKLRVVYRLNGRYLTLIVLVKSALVIKSCWESKEWERKVYKK